jgi:hypothetical protein
MRRCDLVTGASRIHDAMKSLEVAWHEVSDQWNDSVSRRFREEHLDPLIPDVKLALDTISRMNALMDEVQRDCES